MKLTIVFIISSLILFNSGYAQDEAVTKLFNTYIKELNDLNKTKDLKRVLNLLDRNFKTNQTYIGLTGKISRSDGDLSDFATGLQGLMSDRNIRLDLKVDEITNISQARKMATISAVLTMDLIVDGKSAEKGGFAVNMAAKVNEKGEWKFVQSDNIRTVEERNSGNCASYFYERKDGFVTELYYPIGFEYTKNLDVFTIGRKDKMRTIRVNYRQYEWESNGKLFDVLNGERTEIGSTQDTKDAIIFILGQLYEDNCLSFTRR